MYYFFTHSHDCDTDISYLYLKGVYASRMRLKFLSIWYKAPESACSSEEPAAVRRASNVPVGFKGKCLSSTCLQETSGRSRNT